MLPAALLPAPLVAAALVAAALLIQSSAAECVRSQGAGVAHPTHASAARLGRLACLHELHVSEGAANFLAVGLCR